MTCCSAPIRGFGVSLCPLFDGLSPQWTQSNVPNSVSETGPELGCTLPHKGELHGGSGGSGGGGGSGGYFGGGMGNWILPLGIGALIFTATDDNGFNNAIILPPQSPF